MLTETLQKNLARHRSNHLLRTPLIIEGRDNNKVFYAGKLFTDFSSNDYLKMAVHPDVKNAFIHGVQEYGVGSGSSVMVSGFYKPQHNLAEKFAEFLGREKVLIFNSGYHANLGVLSTFATRNSTVISDKLCHASLLDGVILSRAKHQRFPHHDYQQAEALLKKSKKNCLLLTESVFSMEGDICRVDILAALSKKYQSHLIVDDAHAIGVLGKQGRGISEHLGLDKQAISCLITTLGKAFGTMGAVVSGDNDLMEGLIQFARTYIYTTALPPAVAFASLAALKIISKENWRREKLQYLIQYFIAQAKSRGLTLVAEDLTPIKAILIGNSKAALKIRDQLLKHNYLVACIRPPTVPAGTARIRISLNCAHEERDITQLLDCIAHAYDNCKKDT